MAGHPPNPRVADGMAGRPPNPRVCLPQPTFSRPNESGRQVETVALSRAHDPELQLPPPSSFSSNSVSTRDFPMEGANPPGGAAHFHQLFYADGRAGPLADVARGSWAPWRAGPTGEPIDVLEAPSEILMASYAFSQGFNSVLCEQEGYVAPRAPQEEHELAKRLGACSRIRGHST